MLVGQQPNAAAGGNKNEKKEGKSVEGGGVVVKLLDVKRRVMHMGHI